MGKLTLSMAIFNSYVSHYQRVFNVFPSNMAKLRYPAKKNWLVDNPIDKRRLKDSTTVPI